MSTASPRALYLHCADQLARGASAAQWREAVASQADSALTAADVAAVAVATRPAAEDAADFWPALVEESRQMLAGGQPLVTVAMHIQGACQGVYQAGEAGAPADASAPPAKSVAVARATVESLGAVFDQHIAAPLAPEAFFAAVLADFAGLLRGAPAGSSGALYPAALPARFFANPEKLLDQCDRLREKTLKALWKNTSGCEGELPAGAAHVGRLKDHRRYVILRMPPPQFRFEAHFVALVGADSSSPARLFALERGGSPEQAVLAETYADGRLRLGAAGPADSKNFIRLVRQQIGL